MRFWLVAVICKIICRIAVRFGGGTDLPGKVALRLYPNVLEKVRCLGTVIAVTGSNGKTTTANMVAHILRCSGKKVVNNASGSNMTSGIATTLLNNVDLRGRITADYVVIEVDECYARFVFQKLRIDYFLVLNLLRDQVVRNGNPDLVFAKLMAAINEQPDAVLILNANDPISQNLGNKNKAIYFAMGRTVRSLDDENGGAHDCCVCPRCCRPMIYDYFHYNHLGRFHCSECNYASHCADYIGERVDFVGQTLCINGNKGKMPFNATYNVFNVIAAAAVCGTVGLEMAQFWAGLATFKGAKGREERFCFGERTVILLMTKQNAASLEQSISYVLEQAGEKTVVLFVNNVLYLDFKDISWLYDVAFNRLDGKVKNVLCLGSRALDVAVCLKVKGLDMSKVYYQTDLAVAQDMLAKTSGTIYLLAASAFGKEGKIIEEMKK